MKKKSLRVLACVAMLTVGMTLAACGGSKGEAPEASTETQEPAEEAAEEPAEEPKEEESAADTLEGYFSTEEGESSRKMMEDAMSSSAEMTCTIKAEGNTAVITAVMSEEDMADIGTSEEDLALLEETMGQMLAQEDFAKIYEELASQLEDLAGVEGVTVRLEYSAPDGTVLASQEYTAK